MFGPRFRGGPGGPPFRGGPRGPGRFPGPRHGPRGGHDMRFRPSFNADRPPFRPRGGGGYFGPLADAPAFASGPPVSGPSGRGREEFPSAGTASNTEPLGQMKRRNRQTGGPSIFEELGVSIPSSLSRSKSDSEVCFIFNPLKILII